MNRYFIWTIGCQMNKADSKSLADNLNEIGYEEAASFEEADFIILNSCAVRKSAEDRVYGRLGLLKHFKQAHPDTTIALMGCMIDSDNRILKKQYPHIDIFARPQEFEGILNIARLKLTVTDTKSTINDVKSICAFYTIMQGCNNFCSYCIVPYRRGRESSHPLSVIVKEIEQLADHGIREVTLLGQNVDAYGHDLKDSSDLAGLLVKVSEIDKLWRIRFLTSHPRDMSDKLIEVIATLDKVCKHINLPVQSGDTEILEKMNRGYTSDQYRDLVRRIRNRIHGVAISTDVIVGFPGETEEQFANTYKLLKEIRFDTVHVAAYSPRPGTLAAKTMVDNVSLEIKKDRLTRIEELQAGIATEINAELTGNNIEILVENKKNGKWEGRTKTNKLVFFTDESDYKGKLVSVNIKKTSPWALQGEPLKKNS